MIRLGFYGAAGEVTGSCYLLSTDNARVMVDCGMHQGEREADEHNRRLPPIDPAEIDAVVLTHAHLDHCGRLPLLVRHGFKGPIFATPASCELAAIILRDSAQLQGADCRRFNTRQRTATDPCQEPLYDELDVERTLGLLAPRSYGTPFEAARGVRVAFHDAGHILGSGSAHVRVEDGPRTINAVFGGDIGVSGSPILRDPVTPVPADVVLLESTYGDRDHRSLEATRDELLGILRTAQATGGKILIPAFAVGRTQDLIFHMGDFLRKGLIKGLRVFVDSPMATETSELYRRHKDVYDDHARGLLDGGDSPLAFPGLSFVRSPQESRRLNEASGSMVIISASGMCTGGRILHHLRHSLHKPETSVVFVGYQGFGTLGRRLVDGAKSVRIFGQSIEVNATIHTLGGFSAHAGQSGLVHWMAPLARSSPAVFLVHGEDRPRAALKQTLEQTYGLTRIRTPVYAEEAEL
jgi:metallo-beta-lactamase family protein